MPRGDAADGLITLPPPRCKPPRLKIIFTAQTDAQPGITQPVHALPPPQLCPVVQGNHSRLWNEYIHCYHYLGHKPLPGAQLRYFVTIEQQIVAALSFGTAAWQTAPRDQFIGWNRGQGRFLDGLLVSIYQRQGRQLIVHREDKHQCFNKLARMKFEQEMLLNALAHKSHGTDFSTV